MFPTRTWKNFIIRHCSCGHPCGFTIFTRHVGNTQTKTQSRQQASLHRVMEWLQTLLCFWETYACTPSVYACTVATAACTLNVATAAFIFNTQATWSWPAHLTFLTFVKSRLVGPTWQAAKSVKHMAHTSHEERCL